MTPITQEYKEAEQATINEIRDKFRATLSPEDQAKFAAVEKAVDIMVKADILFYLFPQLPSGVNKEKDQVWQWNSLTAKSEYDNAGKLTEKSKLTIAKYNDLFFSSFYNTFSNCFNGNTMSEKLSAIPFFIYECMKITDNYLFPPKDE